MNNLRPALHWLGWSPVSAALAAVLAGSLAFGARGCDLAVPGPPAPIPVPEPAVPREPGNRFPDDAPEPPPAHDFSRSEQPKPVWEWRDLGPGWNAPTEGYGREVDGQFLFFQIRKKGETKVYDAATREPTE